MRDSIVGTYRYIVSALSLPVRLMAYVAGFGGGKERGLQMIEEAAAYPGLTQTEAKFALLLLYNRERRFDDAMRVVAGAAEAVSAQPAALVRSGRDADLRAGRYEQAEAMLDEGIRRHGRRPPRADVRRGRAVALQARRGASAARPGRAGARGPADSADARSARLGARPRPRRTRPAGAARRATGNRRGASIVLP